MIFCLDFQQEHFGDRKAQRKRAKSILYLLGKKTARLILTEEATKMQRDFPVIKGRMNYLLFNIVWNLVIAALCTVTGCSTGADGKLDEETVKETNYEKSSLN